MNLFVLTKDPANRILKFSLDQAIQTDLADFFAKLRDDFFEGIDRTIAFDGKYSPEDDELLEISDFVDIDNLENAINKPHLFDDFVATEEILFQIKAIFTGLKSSDGKIEILLQAPGLAGPGGYLDPRISQAVTERLAEWPGSGAAVAAEYVLTKKYPWARIDRTHEGTAAPVVVTEPRWFGESRWVAWAPSFEEGQTAAGEEQQSGLEAQAAVASQI